MIKKLVALLAIVLSTTQVTFCQWFTEQNSLNFSLYLMQKKEFKLASKELERATFLFPANDSIRELYYYTLWKSRQIREFNLYCCDSVTKLLLPPFVHSRLQLNDIKTKTDLLDIIRSSELEQSKKDELTLAVLLKTKSLERIDTFQERISQQSSLVPLLQEKKTPNKSPILAVTLSAVIPGTGKIYAGRWQDGIFSLLFTGSNLIAAVRSYNKFGHATPATYIFGALSLGFYGGNLYGSWNAANSHNLQYQRKIDEAIDNYFYATY